MIGFLLGSKLAQKIGAVLALVSGAALIALRWAAKNAKIKRLEDVAKTNKDMNDADIGNGNSDADRDWLRKRGRKS